MVKELTMGKSGIWAIPAPGVVAELLDLQGVGSKR